MKIELIYFEEKIVGWTIIPENESDDLTIATMRDLQFFGADETHVEYAGMSLKQKEKGKVLGNLESLSFKQKKYIES